jgi:hypothetical protein
MASKRFLKIASIACECRLGQSQLLPVKVALVLLTPVEGLWVESRGDEIYHRRVHVWKGAPQAGDEDGVVCAGWIRKVECFVGVERGHQPDRFVK